MGQSGKSHHKRKVARSTGTTHADVATPDVVTEANLPALLIVRMAGTPAEGVKAFTAISHMAVALSKVIWVDAGDEVLVHLDSIRVKVLDRLLLVSVDLETDQTGRATLVVSLALGGDGDLAGLVATTDELPRGTGLLASRWGRILQDAVWSALLGIAQDFARVHGGIPTGISAVPGMLKFVYGDSFVVT